MKTKMLLPCLIGDRKTPQRSLSRSRGIVSLVLGLLLPVSAQAVIMDLGKYDPPPGGESAADELSFLNNTVLTAFPALPDATFGTENINASSGGMTSITLNITGFEYLKLKWDGMWQFYFIGDDTGTQTFNSTVFNTNNQPQALSHYTFFNSVDEPGGGGTPGVPDGGTSVVLLGAALTGLFLTHRKYSRK